MLRRILIMAIGALLCCLGAWAQDGVGTWRVHPFFVGSDLTGLIDTDGSVYYLSSNHLFCFDKQTQENESYNKSNYLNDVGVVGLYYNYQKKYVVVAYSNSNLDLIDRNGSVTNLPDIKDAVLTYDKGINDITFSDGLMYVATKFGYVVYDDSKLQVKESRIYGVDVSSLARVGDWLVLAHNGGLYGSRHDDHNNSFDQLKRLSSDNSMADARLLPVGGNALLINSSNGLWHYTLDTSVPDQPTIISGVRHSSDRASLVQPSREGYIASFLSGDNYYLTLDASGTQATTVVAPAELYSSSPDGDGTLWALGPNGLHQANDASNYFKPNSIGIVSGAYYMTYNRDLGKLFLSSSSDNLIAEWGSQLHSTTQIFTYDGTWWADETPGDLPGDGVSSNWQLVMDPKDGSTYVYPSRKYGVVKVTDGKIVNVYDESNSLFGGSNFYKGACAFDSDGNLWVVYSSDAASRENVQNVSVLPRAKYEQSRVTASDWIAVSVPGTKQQYFKGSNFIVVNGIKIYNSGGFQKPFAFWRESGSLSSTPARANYSSFIDQDGKTVTWNNAHSLVADLNGIVWIGLNNGVMSLNPSNAFDEGFTINHIKVPRNDGTGLADYLLDGSQINCMAVDGANRKWLGTNTSGLFLVSADGSQVLRQFTTDNSELTSNTIYSVCCNPLSNSVYVLTSNGFLEYFSDTAPSAADLSNIKVYPNPVRPDFLGTVTITGLMDNSLVKIADSGGHVIKQLRSVGGMATWDCCNENGSRVSTGVYYVLVSEKEQGNAHSRVAKFVVTR